MHEVMRRGETVEELLAELREDELNRADDDDRPWVWPDSFRIRTRSPKVLIGTPDRNDFFGDLAVLSEAWRRDERLLTEAAERAWEPLLAHRKMGRIVREFLAERREELLSEAETLVWDMLSEAEGGTE